MDRKTGLNQGSGESPLHGSPRLAFTSLPAQPGGDGAIDPNKICQMVLFRRGHERKGLSHYEDTQIQDILTDRDRQFVVVADEGVNKYDPEPAIKQQRAR